MFKLQLPFLTTLKEAQKNDTLKNIISNDQKTITDIFLNFLTYSFKDIDSVICTDNNLINLCSTNTAEFIANNLYIMCLYGILSSVFNVNITSITEFLDFVKNREILQKMWKETMMQNRDKLITMYESEEKLILNKAMLTGDITEEEHIRTQYNNIIQNLQNFNADNYVNKFGNFGFMFLIPDILIPAILPNINNNFLFYITTSEFELIKQLQKTNIINDTVVVDFIINKLKLRCKK